MNAKTAYLEITKVEKQGSPFKTITGELLKDQVQLTAETEQPEGYAFKLPIIMTMPWPKDEHPQVGDRLKVSVELIPAEQESADE